MPDLLAKFDRGTSSWKTVQLCLDGDLAEFSGIWPRSGMMLSGTAFQLPPSAPLTNGIASGLLPTPTTQGSDLSPSMQKWARHRNLAAVAMLPTLRANKWGLPDSHGDTSAWNQVLPPKLPTPQARDYFPPHTAEYIATKKAQGHGMSNLNDTLHHMSLPTPRASDADKGGRGDLLTVLRGYETKHAGTLPIPTARDWRSGKASSETHSKNSRPLNETVSAMSAWE